MNATDIKTSNFRNSPKVWAGLAILAGILALLFFDILGLLVEQWLGSEEYSHGIMIPFLTGFLIWQKKNELAKLPFRGSWWGVGLAMLGLALYVAGELATLYILVEYAFLAMLMGGIWAVAGGRMFAKMAMPLFFLFFAIPLPNFLYQGLSTRLQLWSSWLGVSFIRLCDISVFLEGNVIDLGALRLQVADACNGLRYLFPLTSVAFMCAYFYQAAFWKRAVIFLSSLPITILMNSFRIGLIGVMVEYWGKSMAEGFLHDFEGWIVFMGCIAILVAEMGLLARIGGDRRSLREVFGLSFPEPWPAGTLFRDRVLPKPFWAVGIMWFAALAISPTLERRGEIIPVRSEFAEFPMALGEWSGRRQTLDPEYIEALKFEDYILADFTRKGEAVPVNFYSAYYASQRKGEAIHSPRSCLPAGGWEMQVLETVAPPGFENRGQDFRINRVLIRKGEDRQLVYYWFRQRGRTITDEYLAKFYLFWDALTRNRTDGALMRLTTLIPASEEVERAERRLQDFLKAMQPELPKFVAD
jgi:exosortase D (VPLPA-CTERM-specific)